MPVYSSSTISQLSALIADANTQLANHNNAAAMADVTSYYSLQTGTSDRQKRGQSHLLTV